MTTPEAKKIILIATPNPTQNAKLERLVHEHFRGVTTYVALDGRDALFKAENVAPTVAIIDYEIPKVDAVTLTTKLIARKDRMSVLILSPEVDREHFIDEVVTGQVQFLSSATNTRLLVSHVNRALNWTSHEDKSIYHARYLADNEVLLRDGEEGEFVYLVKSGRLKAFKLVDGKEIVLGYVEPGEFVGEMAYINGEPRSANVSTITDCELIEIPSGSLDSVLFSKPAWSKALVRTLSKRLKNLNQRQIEKK
ncbi:MAG: cyclic nucleotide-binding domain-containing protein [Bdellovibrionota bacterium]